MMYRIVDCDGNVVDRTPDPTPEGIKEFCHRKFSGADYNIHPEDWHHWMAEQVRFEAARRIRQLLGTRDADHTRIRISNMARRQIKLMRGQSLTYQEQNELSNLQFLEDEIDNIRNASNALEAMEDIPEDYANSAYWP